MQSPYSLTPKSPKRKATDSVFEDSNSRINANSYIKSGGRSVKWLYDRLREVQWNVINTDVKKSTNTSVPSHRSTRSGSNLSPSSGADQFVCTICNEICKVSNSLPNESTTPTGRRNQNAQTPLTAVTRHQQQAIPPQHTSVNGRVFSCGNCGNMTHLNCLLPSNSLTVEATLETLRLADISDVGVSNLILIAFHYCT